MARSSGAPSVFYLNKNPSAVYKLKGTLDDTKPELL